MSKRSVEKGDKGEKDPVKAREANLVDAPAVALEEKAKAENKNDIWHKSDIYWYLGLLVAALFSFYLRAIIPWDKVFVGKNVIFSSESDAWYHMMLAKGTVINLQRLWFDPMTYFPHGTSLHFGPFNSWAITISSYILGLGHPSMHLVEVIGAFLPAILGVLLVLPVYIIGKEIGGKSCGLISALIIAVSPGQLLSRTTLGFSDHHAAEILFSTFTMAFLLLAMKNGRGMTITNLQKNWADYKEALLYSALSGISLGLYIDAWSSGFLFEGIILLFILLQSIMDHVRGKNVEYIGISGAITFFVALLLVLPFVKPYYGFNHYLYGLFQPTILLLGVVAVIIFSVLSRTFKEKNVNRYYYPGSLAAIAIIGTLILSLAAPQFTRPLFAGLNIFQIKTGGAATVGEIAPLLYYQGELSWNSVLSNFPGFANIVILSSFFLALGGMVLILWRYIKNQKPGDLMILTWSAMILVMTLAQNRFAYYYGVNVALLTGFLAFWLMKQSGIPSPDGGFVYARDPAKFFASNWKKLIAVLLILVFLLMPAWSTSKIVSSYASGPDSDWLTSTAWLRNNTTNPGMDLYEKYEYPANGKYPYPDSAYGIMSWWDYGHLIETIGHRIPNANPFQQGIGSITAEVAGSSPFFLAENESQAEKVLKDLDLNRSPYMNTKYVMIDRDMATGKFHAMAAWSGIPGSKYMAGVYQQQGEQLVPVQIWRESYFKTMTARMFFFDGTEVEGNQGVGLSYRAMEVGDGYTVPVLTKAPKISKNRSELYSFVNESRNQGDLAEIAAMSPNVPAFPMDALQHYRLIHESETPVTSNGQKFVKTFEHVPGAVIKGKAPAGTVVKAAVAVMTNMNRPFIYQQTNTSNADGEFTLVVPYSTEGPIEGGTNFDTKPLSGYQVLVGNYAYEVRIPEEYVLTGAVITI